MDTVYIKFEKTIGEIPKGSIGFIRGGDFNRVFIPRRYTGLDKNKLPCYDMPTDQNAAEVWTQALEEMLTAEEKKELDELDAEIEGETRWYIGSDGSFMRTVGDPKYFKKIKDLLEDQDELGRQ